ncbi:uncharacterized protein LOC117134949 [Drosophila busckii]|uniref:uncharacterized protein LOC117134949 n=1 Tax=Drosophila busckii TaxID=30019 RepID=UPI001432E5F4|nr:uncharacterized protein LOC117134949 [Drosophila busckii]
MSSSHSGTIGRKRVGSGSAASTNSEFYYGSAAAAAAGGEHLRRQRSAEWHSHRHGHGHGYGGGAGAGSSSEDEYQNTGQSSAFDTQLLAQLLLQSQQLASMEHYNSDCEPDYLRQRTRRSGDAAAAASAAAAPEVTYAQPHRVAATTTTVASPLKLSNIVSGGKYQSNANLGLFPNSTSSSSNAELAGSSESEPPPEPAPPEIPPRTQSLLMSLRKHSDYKLKYEEKGDQKHEEFIPTSQLQKEYIISDNLRSVEQQLNALSPAETQG